MDAHIYIWCHGQELLSEIFFKCKNGKSSCIFPFSVLSIDSLQAIICELSQHYFFPSKKKRQVKSFFFSGYKSLFHL